MGKILDIKKYPQKILRQRCLFVAAITERERNVFENMLFTMKHFSGIGLAAPQIGINERLIVVDLGEGPLALANPEVVKIKGKDRMEEGCLSVPGTLVNIERAQEIVVKAINEDGKIVEVKARGLLARILLHEIDHLNGKLIIDYMNLLKKIKFNLNKGRLKGD